MGWERVRGRGKEHTHARTRHRSATHARKHTQRHIRNATNTHAACAVRWGRAGRSVSRLRRPSPFPPPSRRVRVQATVARGEPPVPARRRPCYVRQAVRQKAGDKEGCVVKG